MQRKVIPIAVVAAVLAACDPVYCTAELRTAVAVHVSSSSGLEPDSVTAERLSEQSCTSYPVSDAGDDGHFVCHEQGAGIYTVRVTSGSLTWTQTVDVEADECHTTEVEELHFELDPATAD